MNAENSFPASPPIRIKVFGLGAAGVAMLEAMNNRDFAGVRLIAVDTEAASLAGASVAEKIHLETKMLRGLGTGGDPERGSLLAEAHVAQFQSACAGADAVFVLAGLGGGAGTGIAPVVARVARESGALVLGFVTLPFDCEGSRRQNQAKAGLEALQAVADGVICLPCQKVIKLIDENASLLDTFKLTTQYLLEGIRGIWRLLALKGLIPLHFSDLCAVLRNQHTESCFAAVSAHGPTRVHEAVEKLFGHPMLDGGEALAETQAALVSVVGGPELKLAEVNRVMEQIRAKCPRAELMMGAVLDDAFREQLALTIIATRKVSPPGRKVAKSAAEDSVDAGSSGIETDLLPQGSFCRPVPRTASGAQGMAQKEESLTRQARHASRNRKFAARSRQMPLPLEIVSKSRFDRTEATIHNGEDLDVPTYLRRGISLN